MNTRKKDHDKSKKGVLYIAVILSILVVFAIVFKDQIYLLNSKTNLKDLEVSNSVESFKIQSTDLVHNENQVLNNFLDIRRFNLTHAILSHEIAWLKYYDKTETKDKVSVSNFSLNDNDLVKDANSTATSQADTNVYNPSLKQVLDKNKPQVYIYHTHTTESYFNVSIDFKDSKEKKYNISGVGQILSEMLENDYGIATKQDDAIHNDVYVGSYKHSREALQNELACYSGYKLILDMHRDASDNKNAETININGENVAKIMFVLDIQHEGAEKNIQITNDLIAISNKLFPGFCKGTYTYDGGSSYFNQDLSGNNVLIEVGANCNTLEEAKNSQKYIARIIAEYLNNK